MINKITFNLQNRTQFGHCNLQGFGILYWLLLAAYRGTGEIKRNSWLVTGPTQSHLVTANQHLTAHSHLKREEREDGNRETRRKKKRQTQRRIR